VWRLPWEDEVVQICRDDLEPEIVLLGGNTSGVVRVGDTVRKPPQPDSEFVHRLLVFLEARGFAGAPRFLGVDSRGRSVLSWIDGFAPPNNGFRLPEEGIAAGARLIRTVHDLTAGTEFALGAEVAGHPNLAQQNFILRDMVPVAIIDWDGTKPDTRLRNFGQFLWVFVHPAVYGDGEPAAQMLSVAAQAYGWPREGGDLVDVMLEHIRGFLVEMEGDQGVWDWGARELAHTEYNADLFRRSLSV
jgi:hypothetical protein